MSRAVESSPGDGEEANTVHSVAGQESIEQRLADGKMFQRMECDRCGVTFHFTEAPRATRVPRCPVCGSFGAHPFAA